MLSSKYQAASSKVAAYVIRNTQYVLRIDAGWLIAALLTLFIIQPLLQPGLPAAADIPIHLYRTLEYAQAWSPGVIVPRWAPNLAFGYGYPLFVFTPPLPHLLALAFYGIGLTLETALKLLIIFTILLYAIGAYLLGREVWGSVEAGLVTAAAYAFAPFALREALLYGGNVPQFLAIGLFPWTLWAMTRAASTRAWGWTILAALFYAGVMLSHLFQVLVFTPVMGLYGVLLSFNIFRFPSRLSTAKVALTPAPSPTGRGESRQRRGEGFSLPGVYDVLVKIPLQPLLSLPIGLLFSAFFWLPAFMERFYTRAQADIYLQKSPFFVRYPDWTELVAWIYPLDARAANPYVPLTLGVVTLILAALGLCAGVWLTFKKPTSPAPSSFSPPPPVYRLPSTVYFFASVATAAIFLTLPVSRPVWETITILQVAEFPWRLLGLANLSLAALAGAALTLSPPKTRRWAAVLCLLAQVVTVAPLLYPVTPFVPYGQPTLADQINYERRSQSIGTTTLGEYMPKTVKQTFTGSPLVEALQAGQNPERLDRASLPTGAAAILLEQTAVTHRYRLSSPVNFTLRLWQFNYPGWRAWLDDRPVTLKTEAETGFILVDLPAGEHALTVRFGETPLRLAALALSGLTVLALVIAGGYRYFAQKTAVIFQPPKSSDEFPPVPPALTVSKGVILLCLGLIAAALWLKPLLKPVFTLESPPGQALPAQHQADVRFANGLRLLGYDLNKTVIPAGGRLQVMLYWATQAAPLRVNLQPFVHLDRLHDGATVADATNYTPGDVTTESVLPTFHWDTARYVRDEHDLTLPPDTRPMAYAVRVGLIDPDQQRLLPLADGSGDTARLAVINVSPGGVPLPLAQSFNLIFSNDQDTIRLTGFQLESLTPAQLNFTLSWQSDQQPGRDYTIFAQLLDTGQNLAAGFDRPPLDGAYPTSTWLPGQTIVDPRSIPMAGVAPGQYRLIVGLYDPLTQARLKTAGGADFVELTQVQIANSK